MIHTAWDSTLMVLRSRSVVFQVRFWFLEALWVPFGSLWHVIFELRVGFNVTCEHLGARWPHKVPSGSFRLAVRRHSGSQWVAIRVRICYNCAFLVGLFHVVFTKSASAALGSIFGADIKQITISGVV